MAQVTWRVPDALVARVRRAADQRGSSINEFVTRVLDAAIDPELTDDESLRVRERLAAAGLLAPVGPPRPRPAEDGLAGARRRAGRGEVPAAIWRRHLMGELDPADAAILVAAFEVDYQGSARDQPRFGVVAATTTALDTAAALVGVHGLRAYDAVQLASVVRIVKLGHTSLVLPINRIGRPRQLGGADLKQRASVSAVKLRAAVA